MYANDTLSGNSCANAFKENEFAQLTLVELVDSEIFQLASRMFLSAALSCSNPDKIRVSASKAPRKHYTRARNNSISNYRLYNNAPFSLINKFPEGESKKKRIRQTEKRMYHN